MYITTYFNVPPDLKTRVFGFRQVFHHIQQLISRLFIIFVCSSAPKLKGRPRKRKKMKRPGSPESESASSESSVSTSTSSKVIDNYYLIIETKKLRISKPGKYSEISILLSCWSSEKGLKNRDYQ